MLCDQNYNIPLQSYYFYKLHNSNDEKIYDDVSSAVKYAP